MALSENPLSVGMQVWQGSRKVLIKALIDIETVLVADLDSGERYQARVHDLSISQPAVNAALLSPQTPDLLDIPEEDLALAKARFQAIEPLLGKRTRADVASRAKEVDVSIATLYNWLRVYEETGVLSSLLRRKRSDKGGSRLPEEVEQLIEVLIGKRYLTQQRITKAKFATEVQDACRASGLVLPHADTIRNRLERIPASQRKRKREGVQAAQQVEPAIGEFPGADWPLAYVQVDHTPMDIEVVDEVTRMPIGRPWVTLAIDAFSRVVMGFYISLDPPSRLSIGMCLAQAMLPKDDLVAKAECENNWPIWGKIGTLHADNAKEFRSRALTLACDEYGIDVQWRPVQTPHYGAYIERMMGTVGQELHALPGTTFSNPQQRGDYDSGKSAALTLAELTKWVTHFIVDVYHQRKHSGLGIPPIRKLQEGLLGSAGRPGRGLIPVPQDAARIRLDFMPFIERTIQRTGVKIDKVEYYDPVLRPWIKASDPEDPKHARQFLFRRDPRDISRIYFFDPELKMYFAIPYRNRARPAISIWELRAAAKLARAEQKDMVDEEAIFRANQRLRTIEAQAVEKTRKVRRAVQRRREHGQAQQDVQEAVAKPDEVQAPVNLSVDLPPVEPYDDMSFGSDV